MAKNGFALNKSVTKELQSSLKCSSCHSGSSVELLSRLPSAYFFFCWQHDNSEAQMSVDKSNANRRKEKKKKRQKKTQHFVFAVLPQTLPAPSFLSGTSSQKHAECCSQQASADANETCKTTQNAPLSSVCWRGIKSENADTLDKKKDSRFLNAGSSGFIIILVWRVPGWMCCLITSSKPSRRQCSGQVGGKKPSWPLLWWKASGCPENVIGCSLIAGLWLVGGSVNCNQ